MPFFIAEFRIIFERKTALKKLLFTFLLISNIVLGQDSLSSQAEVSLLTISPGKALYSTFGHSAIRIKDPAIGFDINYNYGSFNTATPDFYLKFLKGQLPYTISAYDFYREMDYWSMLENRGVKEQILNLDRKQKQAIFDFLNNNLKPENREYAYKFFYDNCSTRLRDVIRNICGDSVKFDQKLNTDKSFRDWISLYSQKNNKPWADFGMSLAIGTPADEQTGWERAMFIPDNLHDAFSQAKIYKNNEWQDLVIRESILHPETVPEEGFLFTPMMLFWIILVAAAAITFSKKNRLKNIFDTIYFTVLGISGWILFLLWFFTNHGVTENNFNIMWAFPLLFPLYYFFKNNKLFIWAILGLNALLLIIWLFIPQAIPLAVLPIIFVTILRLWDTLLTYINHK